MSTFDWLQYTSTMLVASKNHYASLGWLLPHLSSINMLLEVHVVELLLPIWSTDYN